MKVLHIIGGGDVGGAKTHVISLINELNKKIDVKLICLRHGEFADDARNLGINVEVIKSGNVFYDIKKAIDIVKNEKYQIVHSHGAKANLFSVFIKYATRVRTVTTVHSDYRLDYMHSIFRHLSLGTMNKIMLRFIDCYIGISRNFCEMLAARNFNIKRIFTLYNGISFDGQIDNYSREDFATRCKLNLNKDDIIVGILVRLHPVKGVNTFLDAASEVLKQNPKVKFLIAGDGEERKNLEHKAKELGIFEKVHFLGHINNTNEFLSIIDINVMASLSESFPYTILEGTRLKKATISSRVGGLPDLIDSGVNGYLFNVGDYKKLAQHIGELCNDSDKRMLMGERIYEKARENFSLKKMSQTQIEIYNSVLNNEDLFTKKVQYDLLISGYYGFENVGDEAMLFCLLSLVRFYKPDIKVAVLSKKPLVTKTAFGVDSIKRTNILSILKTMRNSKLVVSGGGNLIQDSTSTRSLVYYLAIIWLAKKMGLKVLLYANGIGPLSKNHNKNLARRVLNLVDSISLREGISVTELDKLGVDKPRKVLTTDPCLAFKPFVDEKAAVSLKDRNISGPSIGICVRKWGEVDGYEKIIAEVADYAVGKYGVTPVFIPMQYPNDLEIIEGIVGKMKSNKGYIVKEKLDLQQIFSVIGEMDMIIGMRLHSVVFAASSGVPFIGIAYQPKVKAFLQYVKQPTFIELKALKYDDLANMLDYVWSNRADIKRALKQETDKLMAKAFEDAKTIIDLLEGNK